ncbi:MAG TPA: hypothetical protein VNO75_08600 [Gemmatimonadaceae bacterium]|nr:hypothetical protein [Gemmatimonadaceae bacterium]
MRLERPINAAGCSALFAGFGQLLQERRGVAFWHCLEFLFILFLAVIDEARRPVYIGLAITVTAWSVIDAFVWEARRFQAPAT